MSMPGIGELLAIHQRRVQVENDVLAQRKAEVADLVANCEGWARLLARMMEEAVFAYKKEGRDAARRVVRRQMEEFIAVDYRAMKEASSVLAHLRGDLRFAPFARSCASFYESALEMKGVADIYFRSDTISDEGVAEWNRQLASILERVRREGRASRVIEPR